MDVASFERRLLIIRPAVLRDEIPSIRRTRVTPVTPENMLQITISWLAGGNYHTIRKLAGVSVSGIYGYMHEVMDAVCDCANLCIRSPTDLKKRMLELSDGFTSISTDGIMTGCGAASTDGFVKFVLYPLMRCQMSPRFLGALSDAWT